MGAKGTRKKGEAERRRIAERYELGRVNRIKLICRQHGISRDTLRAYAREFNKARVC